MTLEEIGKAKEELRQELAKEDADLDSIETRTAELEAEERKLQEAKLVEEEEARKLQEAQEIEERKAQQEAEERRKVAEAIEKRELNAKKLSDKEERKMSFTLESAEYRSAWAKKMLNFGEDKFTEDEKRALGDAITTTATTFVQSTEDTQGINNGGLFIPTSVRNDILQLIYKTSPFLQDVRKLEVAGNVDLPRLIAADDAQWYVELTSTANEGIEFGRLQLTGWELAKDVEVTWKLEAMTPDSFINFIVEELGQKMGKALATAVLYGNGSSKPTGALNGLVGVTAGTDPIETCINTYKSLGEDARIGAKCYISTDVNIAIAQMKDNSNKYQYLGGKPVVSLFDLVVDPYLSGNDILVGNPRNYVLNTVKGVSLGKDVQIKPRRVVYGAYAIYDGKPIPSSFAKGVWTPSASI